MTVSSNDNDVVRFLIERTSAFLLADVRSVKNIENVFEAAIGLCRFEDKEKMEIFYKPIQRILSVLYFRNSYYYFFKKKLKRLELKLEIQTRSDKTLSEPAIKHIINEKLNLVAFCYAEFIYLIEESVNFLSQERNPQSLHWVKEELLLTKSKFEKLKKSSGISANYHKYYNLLKKEKLSKLLWKGDILEYKNSLTRQVRKMQSAKREIKQLFFLRNEFLSTIISLKRSDLIKVTNTTDVPHLFELWCFYEFINTPNYKLQFTQNCYFDSKINMNIINSNKGHKIYYNFGRGVQEMFPSKIFTGSSVEWVIKTKDSTVLIDTKFTREWRIEDNQKMLAYILDFDADIGVVVFSKNFNKDHYHNYRSIGDDIIVIVLPNNKKFFAVSLQPYINFQKRNAKTLSILHQQIFN